VVGIARSQEKLDRALKFGADFCINSTDKDARAVSKEWKAYCKENGLPSFGWKIFEVTGVKAGQEIGLSLLGFVGKLIVVGFGLAKTEYAFGRLMAFDCDILGTWGCLPEYYPAVLDMVLRGKIDLESFVETKPMSTISETFEAAHKTPPMKRIVLTPDF
jgi:6-hydroxycyclohex-1-ene-1-carbonyl-CoA dehydrogenase